MPFRKRPFGLFLRNFFDSDQSVSSPCQSRLEQAGLTDRRRLLAQIASGDLNIAIIGQLPPTQLSLRDHLETGPLEVECFKAPLRRRALIEEPLEDPAGHPDVRASGATLLTIYL